MEILDWLFVETSEYLNFIRKQYENRSFWMWFLFFFPFVVFLEIPRYTFPLIIYPLAYLFGFTKDDLVKKQQFMQQNPSVSVVVAAHNEEDIIAETLKSLLQIQYDNLEIIVIDDGSTDRTHQIASTFEEQHEQLKLFVNSSRSGRGGRPAASNYGYRMATGEFIISVDADTTFDRNMLLHAVGPFYDPDVGVVTGNLKARNRGTNILVDLQACEYLMSIGFWKQWTDLFNVTLHASGAFSVFRREVLETVGAWDPELTEDADISAKAHKLGWTVRFAPLAIAMTSVPDTVSGLLNQRYRWDRGFLRTYYHKHGDALRFWRFQPGISWELIWEYLMQVVMTLLFPVYIIFMLIYLPLVLTFIMIVTYLYYCAQTLIMLSCAVARSERASTEWTLLQYSFVYPFYQTILRLFRGYALIKEIFRLDYRDPYLPESVHKNTKKW